MITKIGLICGEILELLENTKGIFVFGEVHSTLNQPRDLVMMGLGWLLCEGYIEIIEDPTRACYRTGDRGYTAEASMFDLIIESKLAGTSHLRVKEITQNIHKTADKILTLLEEYEGLWGLHSIEKNVNEHRDIVLMSLGWLIREGYVRWIKNSYEVLIRRLPKAKAYKTVAQKAESLVAVL
jgi:3-methyladenine DNA glycosylase AlkD